MASPRCCKACDYKDREIMRLERELRKVIRAANSRIQVSMERETYLQSRITETTQELKVLREAKGLNLEMLTLAAKVHAPC